MKGNLDLQVCHGFRGTRVLDEVSGVFDQDFFSGVAYLRRHGEELNRPQVPRAKHLWTMSVFQLARRQAILEYRVYASRP